MNRVVFTVLQKGTNVNTKYLQQLQEPSPFEMGYVSEQFPVYPITICLFIENPPFNKFSIFFQQDYVPSKATLYQSEDAINYSKLLELGSLKERQDYVKIFEKKVLCSYLRLVIHQPQKNKRNICKQVKIRGFQLALVNFFHTKYICSLGMRLTHHPILFRMLQVLQYKGLLLRQNQDSSYYKYEGRLGQVLRQIAEGKINQLHPQQQILDKYSKQINIIEKQPLNRKEIIDLPDPQKLKKDIYNLQKQIRKAEVNNFGQIKPHVQKYFDKYRNTIIKDSFLRYLSSSLSEDHQSALVKFWGDVKELQTIPPPVQEAIIMFFNFFLQHLDSPLKVNAVKTLLLFAKRCPGQVPQIIQYVYIRLLQNNYHNLHQQDDEDLRTISLRYCYVLFQKINNHSFIESLLLNSSNYTLQEQLLKLQILQKTTFRQIQIGNRKPIITFLLQLLLRNDLSLNDKNKAYNIAAYLSSVFGKSVILKEFQKLNSMLLMTMEKNIDKKIAKIQQHQGKQKKEQVAETCEYCGKNDYGFSDQHLYDLHLAKQCKYLTSCPYCQQMIQIPELFKHYIQQCERKHEFKHCQQCFEVIKVADQNKHQQQCPKKLQSKCPLCYQKVEGKLQLKQHILNQGCPNNYR